MLHAYWEEPDLRNTDTITNYSDTPMIYAVDVLEGAVLKTYRRLAESRNRRHVITMLSWAQTVTAEAG